MILKFKKINFKKECIELVKRFFIILSVLLLSFACLQADYLYIDNFDDGCSPNLNSGKYVPYEWGGGSAELDHSENNSFGNNGYSLMFTYNVSSGGAGSMFWMNLKENPPGTVQTVDLTQYDYLSFWIRGELGGEVIRIAFNDDTIPTPQESSIVDIRNHISGGGITTSWKKVVIPLTALRFENFNEQSVKSFLVKTEYAIWGSGSHSGTVYIDEILLSTGTTPVPVDSMEVQEDPLYDLSAFNVTVYGTGGSSGGPEYYHATNIRTNDSYQGDNAFYIRHITQINGGSYAFCMNNWMLAPTNIGLPRVNVSACNALEFYAKTDPIADTGGSRYVELGAYKEIGNFSKTTQGPLSKIDGLNNTYQQYVFDFSDLLVNASSGFSLSNLFEVRIVSAKNGGNTTNITFLDEMRFIDTIPPKCPTNIRVNGVKLTNNFNIQNTENLITCTLLSNELLDPSFEGIKIEYRVNDGVWKIIGFDYNSVKTDFTNLWNASGLKNSYSIDMKISSLDSSGNMSSNIFTNCHVPSSASYVYCDLTSNPPGEYGLYFHDYNDFHYTNSIYGSPAWNPVESSWGGLAFKIADGFAYRVTNDNYYYVLAFEYLDKGTNTQVELNYDDRDNLLATKNYKQLFLDNMRNTLTWKTNYVLLTDAYWGNRFEAYADFLIKGEEVIYLRRVTVYKVSSTDSAVALRLSASDNEMGVGTLNKVTVEAVNEFNFKDPYFSGTASIKGDVQLSDENVELNNGDGSFYVNSKDEGSSDIEASLSGLSSDSLTATFQLFYGFNYSKNIFIELGSSVVSSNLYLIDNGAYKTTIGNKDAYRTVDGEWKYLLFDIDSSFVYNRTINDGYVYDITIEYYDTYSAPDDDPNNTYIVLKYDSINDGYDKLAEQKIVRQNSKTWKTFTFTVKDCLFKNNFDTLGDFALSAYDTIYIRNVKVSRRNYYYLSKAEELKIESTKANLTIKENSALNDYYIIPNNLLSTPTDKIPLSGRTYSINNKNLIAGCDFLVYDTSFKKMDHLYLKKTAQMELLYNNEDISSEINENNLAVYFFNQSWEKKGGNLDTLNNKMSLNVNHLSLYAIFESNPGKDFLIEWENNPFSPNGDGIMDTGMLHVILPESVENLRVFIYNLKGAFVRELTKQETSVGQVFEWDGKNQQDQRVPIGPYVYQVEYDEKVYNGIVAVVR